MTITVIRKEKRQRSILGTLIKWAFIGFNVLMLVWMISGMSAVSGIKTDSAAAQAGHIIGATIGFTVVLSIWAMGDIVLGILVLLTRGDKIIIEETPAGAPSIGPFGHAQEAGVGALNADEMISRYMHRQDASPRAFERSPPPSPQTSFGRRR